MILNYQPSNHDFQNYQIKECRKKKNVIELKDKYKFYILNLKDSNRSKTKCTYWLFILFFVLIPIFLCSKPQILSLYLIVILFSQFIVSILSKIRIENFIKLSYFEHYFECLSCLIFRNKTIDLIKSQINFFSSQTLKCIFLTILLFSPGSVLSSEQKNTTTFNATENCPDDYLNQKPKYQLEYDETLFNELKMHDTLLNLYRSCYKHKFNDQKTSKYKPKPGQNTCKKKPITSNDILVGLLLNKENTLLPQDILDRIDLVCSNDQVNVLEKIYLLADYEHSLCGNVYRNSIKGTHLDDYILGINRIEKRSNHFHSISNHHHHNRHHNSVENQYSIKNPKPRDASLKNLSYSIQVNSVEQNDSRMGNYSNMTDFYEMEAKNPQIIKKLNNCTLILLNVYLLSHKASCDFEDFVESLNHFDCLSNNFSVKSDCTKCQNAYKKWLCSETIPYYHERDKIAKPCQRYCYNVQNLCPFFRPVDNYGGQPVFNCRNVIQVLESRPDGYEDDDENYIDEDKYDDDRCYGECTNSQNQTVIEVDLSRLIREKSESMLIYNSSNIEDSSIGSLFELWTKKRSEINVKKLESFFPNVLNKTFNSKGRFKEFDECFFGLQPVSASSGHIFKLNIACSILFFVTLKLFIPFLY